MLGLLLTLHLTYPISHAPTGSLNGISETINAIEAPNMPNEEYGNSR